MLLILLDADVVERAYVWGILAIFMFVRSEYSLRRSFVFIQLYLLGFKVISSFIGSIILRFVTVMVTLVTF